MDIPKPPPAIPQDLDQQDKYLKEWKRLFEAIDQKITVVLYSESNFRKVLDSKFIDYELAYFLYKGAKIIVELPPHLQFEYLIGVNLDQMFSYKDVQSDPLLGEYDCEPQTKKWSEYYKIISDLSNKLKKQIPAPPKKETS